MNKDAIYNFKSSNCKLLKCVKDKRNNFNISCNNNSNFNYNSWSSDKFKFMRKWSIIKS